MHTASPRTQLVPATAGSALALSALHLHEGAAGDLGEDGRDSLVYIRAGAGSIVLDDATWALGAGSAALVLAGEQAALEAGPDGLEAILATIGPEADRHAPLGPRDVVATLDDSGSEQATGARSYRLLFGPHNGSTRATLFLGYIPPGRAPWHYHLYDEIVWVPDGPGRLHVGEAVTELSAGSAFRLRPRQVHIVENTKPDEELTIVGVFTPAGSPSAAYLEPEVAAEYRFAG